MRYPITGICTLFGLALCLFNFTGFDPHNLFFMMFSVPMWIVEFFIDMHRVDVRLMYVLTVLSWALIGYLGDLGVARTRSRARSRA